MQNQWGLPRCEVTYLKQYLSHGALTDVPVFQPQQNYTQCTTLSLDVTRLWIFPDWPVLGHPSLPWAPEPTINVLFTLLYTYPSMYSLFSLDPSRVCPFLCGQDCTECLTPRQDGISVCWLNNSGKGLKFEWNWCEWKRDERCHNIVKENLAQLKGKKEKQKTGKRF